MIDQEVMDKIIRVPDIDDEMEAKIEELQEEGFVVTNFAKGGIFYTILWAVLFVGIQLKELAVDIINSAFMAHCPDDWVEIRAADYSKSLKEGVRTEGVVTVVREDASRAFLIRQGHPFRTENDAYGDYKRYYALQDTALPEGAVSVDVPVQAEEVGAAYNVAAGEICRSMIHIDGLDHVTNGENWITTEGEEEETLDALRKRCLNSRSENAERNIDRKIKSLAETVSGVVVAYVDSQHPRGQGTVDVIITSNSGAASEKILQEVRDVIEPTRGSYGDYLVKSSEAKPIDISVTVYIQRGVSTAGLDEKAEAALRNMMNVQTRAVLNEFYPDEIRGVLYETLKGDGFLRCDIISPAAELVEDIGTVITLGGLTVTVRNI